MCRADWSRDEQGCTALVAAKPREGNALFAADATFCPVTGLTGQYTSLRSYNYPNHYLRHNGLRLYIDVSDGTDQFRKDATFAVRPALAGA